MQFVSVKNIFGLRFVLSPQSISRWQKSAVTCSPRHCSALKTPAASPIGPATDQNVRKTKLANGPGLNEFLIAGKNLPVNRSGGDLDVVPYLDMHDVSGRGRKVFFEVYGCQMNVNDTEIVWSILKSNDYEKVEDVNDADVVLLVTCAIREKAESKVTKLTAAEQRNITNFVWLQIWNRLVHLAAIKKRRKHNQLQVGVLGCMAERLKTELLEKQRCVDIVAGPDSYKDLPRLLAITKNGQNAVNVQLSLDETYADIMPVRLNRDSVTAFL